jgi:hypothetical protein
LTAEKVYFTNNNGAYTDSSATGKPLLIAQEPSINWISGPETALGANLTTPNTVIASTAYTTNGGVAATSAVLLVAKAANGDCWYILDDTLTASPLKDAVGTSYLWDDNCSYGGSVLPTPVTLSGTTALVAHAATTTLTWASNF